MREMAYVFIDWILEHTHTHTHTHTHKEKKRKKEKRIDFCIVQKVSIFRGNFL